MSVVPDTVQVLLAGLRERFFDELAERCDALERLVLAAFNEKWAVPCSRQ